MLRSSDGAVPDKIAFLQCVGSRDANHDYCSSVCCMYAAKQATRLMEQATDDTQVRVLNPERRVKKPPGEKRKQKKGAQKGTLWVYVGDESTVFDYTKSRSRDGPLRFLEGYRGYLQADGFPGYRAVYRRGGVTEVACMAHARRKFHDARSNDRRRCRYALDRFGELYQIERDLKTGVPRPKRVAHSVRLWLFRFSRRSKPGSTLNARGCCPRARLVRPSAMR